MKIDHIGSTAIPGLKAKPTIRFRDYLIRYPKIAREYESLKLKLAEQYPNDREAYTASKTDWILRMNERIREQDGRVY
ncbi:MAG: GrpB family protein [Bacteroidales bacterium]|nr:GrpB family protein [Bacteroidales bacterium]MCF8344689.1 GrpB family protein [Bacteroidales bacterium]MCF8351734.1 GrpB family protein [Bacteroidales bacterium]MCF8376649.1 GrpB family protein [Bacteroidales bacterium]